MYIIAIQDNNGDKHLINLSQVISITKGLQPNSYLIYCRGGNHISISKELFDKLFFDADFVEDDFILEKKEETPTSIDRNSWLD